MASVIRGSDNFDSLVHQGIGVNQTWQDVTSSRANGVTYTNTTGKPIFVWITSSPWGATEATSVSIAGISSFECHRSPSGTTYDTTLIVPNGTTYSYYHNIGFSKWLELR